MSGGNFFLAYQLFSVLLGVGLTGLSLYFVWRAVRALEGIREELARLRLAAPDEEVVKE